MAAPVFELLHSQAQVSMLAPAQQGGEGTPSIFYSRGVKIILTQKESQLMMSLGS